MTSRSSGIQPEKVAIRVARSPGESSKIQARPDESWVPDLSGRLVLMQSPQNKSLGASFSCGSVFSTTIICEPRFVFGSGHQVRIAIDTGGTFTDCVFWAGGALQLLKIFSTPDHPGNAALQAVREMAPGKNAEVRHGTTVGTN